MPRNKITGLSEDWYPPLKVPMVKQRSVGTFDVRGQAKAVHSIPLGNDTDFFVYTRIQRSEYLFVVFSDRVPRGFRPGQPAFATARAFRGLGASLMVLEDPQIAKKGLKGWFLGSPDNDVISHLARLIPKVCSKSGARRVIFLGEGSGAHGALRAMTFFPEAVAVVVDAEIDPALSPDRRAYREVVSARWGSSDVRRSREEAPELFHIGEAFRETPPRGWLWMMQSLADATGVKKSYLPMKDLFLVSDATGSDFTGRKSFLLDDPRIADADRTTRLVGLLKSLLKEQTEGG